MASPIFFPAFVKKYVVQTRYKYSEWKEYDSYRSLDHAERIAQEISRKKSEIEVRILNRFTGQIVKEKELKMFESHITNRFRRLATAAVFEAICASGVGCGL